MGKGKLIVELFVGDHVLPIGNADVLIKDLNGNILQKLVADKHGHTEEITLDAPDRDDGTHFAAYDVEVPAYKGFKKAIIHGTKIFDGIKSILPVQLHPTIPSASPVENTDEYYIPREQGVEIDRMAEPSEEAGQGSVPERPPIRNTPSDRSIPIINNVSIPEYVTVHLGSPNIEARNVRVAFKDYIKNVASSEIFPTWEPAAIEANIYAQISFTLNRFFTEIRRYR